MRPVITPVKALLRQRERILSAKNDLTAEWYMRLQASGDGALWDWSGNGHHGWFGGVKKAVIADTTVPDRGLILPGIAGNYASVPDSAALDIVGDIEIQCYARLTDWTPSGEQALVTKYAGSDTKRSYKLSVTATTGLLTLKWTTNGLVGTILSADSTVAPTVADGAALWVKATMDVDDGSGNRVIEFFTSSDGSTWTKLGNTVTTVGTTSIYSSGQPVEIGAGGTTGDENLLIGTIYRAIIKDGIGGTTVLDVDFTTQAQGTRSFTCSTGQTVTVNTAGTSTAQPTQLFYSGTTYMWLPGSNGNYASVPDEAALDITGDIDIRCKVALTDWTPSAAQTLVGKHTGDPNRAYVLDIAATTGYPRMLWWPTGSAASEIVATATAAPTVADGSVKWIRGTLDVDNGAGAYDVKFYTSDDGVAWTQLGSTVTGGSTTSIAATTAFLGIGAYNTGGASNPATGKFYAAQIYSGIAGSKVLDIDFTATASYNATQTTLTAVTGQTVTINRSATGLKTAIVTENVALFDGVDDYISVDDHDRLDFAATESFTVAASVQLFGGAGTDVLVCKAAGLTLAETGWTLHVNPGSVSAFAVQDGSARAVDTGAAPSNGVRTIVSGRRSVSEDNVTVFTNGTSNGSTTDGTTATLANAGELRVGRLAGAGTAYAEMEFYSAALFRRALRDWQIKRLQMEL